MALTTFDPNTVYLGGGEGPAGEDGYTPINDIVAYEALTPGFLVEYVNDGGTLKWKAHDTADNDVQRAFALDQPFLNRGVDDDYAVGDNVLVGVMRLGAKVWAIIPSGQNISPADLLQSNGDGKLKALASGKAVARALESSGGAVTADTRLRVEVI